VKNAIRSTEPGVKSSQIKWLQSLWGLLPGRGVAGLSVRAAGRGGAAWKRKGGGVPALAQRRWRTGPAFGFWGSGCSRAPKPHCLPCGSGPGFASNWFGWFGVGVDFFSFSKTTSANTRSICVRLFAGRGAYDPMFMAITAELEPFWDSWFASGESLYKFDIPRVAGPRGAQVQNHLRRSPWEGGMTCVRESKRERERERERRP